MALAAATLAQNIQDLGDPTSPRWPGNQPAGQAARLLVSAYDGYAKQAVDLSGDRFLGGNTAAMQATLAPLFASSVGDPATAAQVFGLAHTAYWTGGQFAIGIPPAPGTPGVVGGNGIFALEQVSSVTAAIPTLLTVALASLFASPSTDPVARARAFAQAWHAASTAVVVVIIGLDATPPPAGPLPITATGGPR